MSENRLIDAVSSLPRPSAPQRLNHLHDPAQFGQERPDRARANNKFLPFFRTIGYDACKGEAGLSAEPPFLPGVRNRKQAKRNSDQALENTRSQEIINFAAQ
jgi:hypothetical protein